MFSKYEWTEFLSEAVMMGQLSHKNVLGLVGLCVKEDSMLIATPFCEKGSLRTVLRDARKNGNPIGFDEKIDMCAQIARGCKYLISCNVVHRDIATRNVLVTSRGVCKLCDYGLARRLEGAE